MKQLHKSVVLFIIISLLISVCGFSLTPQKQSTPLKKTNINTADVEQLIKLSKIGPKTAKRIIDFRKKHGKFKRIQDLMKVKGIGEKTFKKLEKQITV